MLHRDSTIQKCFRVRRFSVPCQPSRRPSHPVRTPICHCSIRPDAVPYCPDSRQTKPHPSGRRVSPSRPSTMSRRFCPACIRPDVSAARLDTSQYSNSLRFFPSSNKGKIDQPSGRCGIPSRRVFIKEGNCRFDFNRPDDCLSWFGHVHIRYGNSVLKFSRPDAHPPWSGRAKPYKEITCSRRVTVRTRFLNRKDFLAKFSAKSCRTVVCPDGPCPSSGRRPCIFCLTLI
jgi:hypothetical protein